MNQVGGAIANKAINEYISTNVVQGETVVATAIGLSGDFLLVTNKKVVILKKGMATWATGGFGLKTKSYLLDKINSIDISKGLIFCDLEIVSGGMVEKKGGSFFAAAESENIFQFEKKHYEEMTTLVNQIRALIERSSQQASAKSDSIPDLIGKLAELRDQGILTETEFNEKKLSLLGRL
jgi:hypothetical protein